MIICRYRNLVLFASLLYLFAFSAVLLRARAAFPQETAQALSRQAYRILRQNCFGCHGAAKTSGLDLRTAESIRAGGEDGAVIVPSDPQASRLYQFVSHQEKPTMPPGKKLPDSDIEILRRWIESGASFEGFDRPAAVAETREKPEESKLAERPITPEERRYWAFQPPKRTNPPRVAELRWNKNPVDAFLLAAMKSKGLKPSPRADRRTLIRRAYLDVTGLPPSPEEVEAFVKDVAPDAWEKLVDR